jgi:hypothetical protein
VFDVARLWLPSTVDEYWPRASLSPSHTMHMWFHISLALLLQAAPLSQPRLAASPLATDALTDVAGYAVLHFLSTWRTAWRESVDLRSYGHVDVRLRDDHCHWDGSYSGVKARGEFRPPSLIHRSSRRSMCPNWYPADEPSQPDERLEPDVSLSPLWRDRVQRARTVLIDSLNMLATLRPGDAWITGERVRFLVDQDEIPAAIEVARHCTADRVWCAQLTGYALHAARDFVRADSAFDAAAAAMSSKARCEWTSARYLLDPDGRSAYEHMSCEERAAANERLWWLSTPLFSDSASSDDRRSEDFSRKVMIQLHSALPWDERFDWRDRFGGEAVSEMLVRYGWPAFSAFGGAQEEASHASWMNFYDSTRTATAEYPQDRAHVIPDWRAVTDPFHSTADLWRVNMPALRGDDEPAAQWWPAEHYAYAGGTIVQLPDQTAVLRRDDDVLLATASELRSGGRTVRIDSDAAVLVRTTEPHKVERVAHQTFRNQNTLILTARIPAKPAVVGAEIPAREGAPAARTRFGVMPPLPLAELKPGETAISEPVLISTDDDMPPGPDGALKRMLGTTRVRGAKVGVYWETYGYAAGDSVDVAVVISRHEPISKMRRIGMALHLAHDLNGSVAVRWGEPQPGHSSWIIPGVVPIQARSVRIDLSRIEPGHYSVEVLVGRKGGVPVTASRDFVFEGT